jgi:two-component system repressor protein LuxO
VVRPLAIVEREAIEHAIRACNDNIPRAAALLEVSPSTIYRKKQAWDRE